MEAGEKRKLRKSLFYLDILPQKKYHGYTFGDSWNGWACPYFAFKEAERIAEDQRLLNDLVSDGTDYKARYIEEEDMFSFYEPYEDDWYNFEPIEVNGKKLYPIGTRYWTWSEVPEG
jgi:hypothetical protein